MLRWLLVLLWPCFPPRGTLQVHRHNDDDPLHRTVEVVGNGVGEIKNIANHSQHDGANHRAPDAPMTTLEHGATDDHRGNRF